MTFQNYSKMQILTYSAIGLGLYFTLWLFPINLIVVHLLTRAYIRDKDNLLESLQTESIVFTKSCITQSLKCVKKVREYMEKDNTTDNGDETDTDSLEPTDNLTNDDSNTEDSVLPEEENDSEEKVPDDTTNSEEQETIPNNTIDSGEEEDDEDE